MKKYFSMILLAASLFGFTAMADDHGDQIVTMTADGNLQIQSNYLCPGLRDPRPNPRPSMNDPEIIETLGWGRNSDHFRPRSCYTNGEPCPGGYSETVRLCWDDGWYRCGYQCDDIYIGGGDGGAGCQSTDPM